MKSMFCKMSESEIKKLPEKYQSYLLSLFFIDELGYVNVPADTFQEMTDIIIEAAQAKEQGQLKELCAFCIKNHLPNDVECCGCIVDIYKKIIIEPNTMEQPAKAEAKCSNPTTCEMNHNCSDNGTGRPNEKAY